MRMISRLIKKNELEGFDPSRIASGLDAFFKEAGIKDYSYYISYMGTEYCRIRLSNARSVTKFVYTSDYSVFLEAVPCFPYFYTQRSVKMLTDMLFFIIVSDISIQIKTVQTAFRKSFEIQTFINHDVKNLIQFVSVLEHNLEETNNPDDAQRLIKYLRKGLPELKRRSDKIHAALNSTMPEPVSVPELVDVTELMRSIAASCGVSVNVESDNSVRLMIMKKILCIIFENIVKNFYDKSMSEKGIEFSFGAVEIDGEIILRMKDSGSPISDCEKIFEPFYSGRVGGLGVGLYHCRYLAQYIDAVLSAENTAEGPVFTLRIKKS